MFASEGTQAQADRRVPLAIIAQAVSVRLGQTRVQGNAQRICRNHRNDSPLLRFSTKL